MAAAWQLSKLGGYKVTVYESSSRLGGKCASSRDYHGRIHEHGLHVWLGFYENAFRMMRECYAEVESRGWGPGALPGDRLSHGSIEDAFFSEPNIGVAIPAKEVRRRRPERVDDLERLSSAGPGTAWRGFRLIGPLHLPLLVTFCGVSSCSRHSCTAPSERPAKQDLSALSPRDAVRLQEAIALGRDFDARQPHRLDPSDGEGRRVDLSFRAFPRGRTSGDFAQGIQRRTKSRSEFLLDLMIAVAEGVRGRLERRCRR